jgi:hypothetical protein
MTSLAKERKNRTTQKTCDKAKKPQKAEKSEPVAKNPQNQGAFGRLVIGLGPLGILPPVICAGCF